MPKNLQPTDDHLVLEEDYKGRWIAVSKRTGHFVVRGIDHEYRSLYLAKDKADELAKRKRNMKRKALNVEVVVFDDHGYTRTTLVRTSARSNYGMRPIVTTKGADGKADTTLEPGSYGFRGMALIGHIPEEVEQAMQLFNQANDFRERVAALQKQANNLLAKYDLPQEMKRHGVNCVEDAIDYDNILREWIEKQRSLYPATKGE